MFVLRFNFPAIPSCECTCQLTWGVKCSQPAVCHISASRDDISPAGPTKPRQSALQCATVMPASSPDGPTTQRQSALQCATVMPATVWLTTPEFSASKIQDYIWKSRLEHFSRFISAGNEQIPHAEMNRFLTRKWTDSSRGNREIPRSEIRRFLAEMLWISCLKCSTPTLPVPDFWRSPTCSFWFRSITCGPDPATLFWTKKFLRLTPSSYLILNIHQSFEF
jgi:hypothetical protein